MDNNLKIFFIRDPLKFPDLVHAFKPDPVTNIHDPATSRADARSAPPQTIGQWTKRKSGTHHQRILKKKRPQRRR